MKKKLYYSARAKTLRRDVAGAAKLAEAGRDAMLAEVETALTETRRREKAIERCLDADEDVVGGAEQPAASTSAPSSPSSASASGAAARRRRVRADARVRRDREGVRGVRVRGARARERERASSRWSSRPEATFDSRTGARRRTRGARRARISFAGVSSRNDYRGRLDAALPGGRPTGVRVLRVARARNRRLRDAFDRAVRAASSSTAASSPARDLRRAGRRAPRVPLPRGGPGGAPGELRRCLEDGFRSPAEYAALGRDEAVVLTDSLSLADNRRLERAPAEEAEEAATEGSFFGAKKRGDGGRRGGPGGRCSWRRRTWGRRPASRGTRSRRSRARGCVRKNRSETFERRPRGGVDRLPSGAVSRSARGRTRASTRVAAPRERRETDGVVRAEQNLALPEYLVEFEYETARAPSERGEHPRFAELIHGTAAGGARGEGGG